MHHRFSTLLMVIALATVLASAEARAGSGRWGKCSAQTRKIVEHADRIALADSSAGIMTMRVVKPRRTSVMKMKFWSSGRNKMLVRILSPARVKGMATLKVDSKVWYYMPRTDRIVRVGTSMLSESWMGSHFTNDDLVKETELDRQYTCVSRKDRGDKIIVVVKPRPNAPVIWSTVEMTITKKGWLPVKVAYYGHGHKLKRTMTFSDVRTMDGRLIPTKFRLQPAGKSEYTEIVYHKIRFHVAIPNRYFSLRGLTR